MVKYYPSISPDFQDWILAQPVFFVASAPLTGKHINVSPKGLPSSSLSVLNPNEVAYIDSTGSGNETLSHIRENGRCTIMFCSFDVSPRIMRLFCRGEVAEWNEPAFQTMLGRMALEKEFVQGARAVMRLDVFKVQTSCGFGVPRLALTTDPKTNEPKPYLEDRRALGHFAAVVVAKNQIHTYQRDFNADSLDGLPGMKAAMRDRGMRAVDARIWLCRQRRALELVGVTLLSIGLTVAVMWVNGWTRF
ncbi:pyridoxamine phosphate oxidase [Coccidioides immitis RS]|uniref:Pyridoxamine phosphate oxidase n=2 Tax=Coccidioides immitis TaxID=5501 RepID=A0A0D8JTE8_COCIM|nr:pyridoxamine phosphate oxidase [Coccidioides immitis RS]KJF60404.1 pyridoxamine phosphate oxidase [Coccidioides immitis RS]KMU90571.1 hypothetical protein CIHG_08287 [Coccidioides immitis H538.4]